MEQQQQHEMAAPDEDADAWQVFQFWTGSRNRAHFRAAYLGRYDSRDAFGQLLLSQWGADIGLQRLPGWLRAYVRLDGAAVVADFERAGHFCICDAPDGTGAFIFDRYALDGPAPDETE